MFVFKAAVVGAGTMGGQIAQTIAAAASPSCSRTSTQSSSTPGSTRPATSPRGSRQPGREGKITAGAGRRPGRPRSSGRIAGTTSYEDFGDVDFVIEAVPERMEIKQAVFAELDAATPGHAILASNTSSLSITEIGDATLRPGEGRRLPLLLPAPRSCR